MLERLLAVRAFEVNHWGARTFFDAHRGYNSYLIESGRRRVLYGDTDSLFVESGAADVAAANSLRIHARSSTLSVAWEAISCAKKRYAAAVGTRPAEV